MNKTILFLSLPLLITSPLFMMANNSWLSMWISLEINIMSFIPLMIFLNKKNKTIANKYFIVQTISSMIFLFAIFLNISLFKSPIYLLNNYLMNLSIFIKLSSPPFQNWFIDLMKNMTWINCSILSNWQKIIPLMILSHIYSINLIYLIILMSIPLTMMSLNFYSMHLIMSFSSVTQMNWILLIMTINELTWKWYFTFYMIINNSIMILLNKMKIHNMNQFNNMYNLKMYKYMFIMMILSISGLPPFLGFLIKMTTIYISTPSPIILIMMLMTMITFIMYTRMSMSLMINSFIKNKVSLLNKLNKNNIFFIEMLTLCPPLIFWGLNFMMT